MFRLGDGTNRLRGQNPAQIAEGRGMFMKNQQVLMMVALTPGHLATGWQHQLLQQNQIYIYFCKN
jgi:hypothetical protein